MLDRPEGSEQTALYWPALCADRLLVLYQKFVSPLLGPRCRFYPSCSAYARECLHKYPFSRAIRRICIRLCKCHPFHPGGLDLP